MKFYLALVLSAAAHIATGVLMSQYLIKANPTRHIQRPLLVSFKHTSAEAPAKKTGQKPQSNQAIKQSDPLTDYLSEQDVEIKALPSNNIDHTKLNDVFISGLPIKMRLYINSEGRVVKIDRLDALAQDFQLQEALEKTLLEMSFLPAKKNGIVVNSYQDIAFSFN